MWEWQLPLLNLLERQSSSRVPLAHKGMAKQSYIIEHSPPYHSMANVRLGAIAVDSRSIGVNDAYVVQHSSLDHEVDVDRSVLRNKPLGKFLCQFSNLGAMLNQQLTQLASRLIKPMDYL